MTNATSLSRAQSDGGNLSVFADVSLAACLHGTFGALSGEWIGALSALSSGVCVGVSVPERGDYREQLAAPRFRAYGCGHNIARGLSFE